jgi:replicative DNA helicase
MPPFKPVTGPDPDSLPLACADERLLIGALIRHGRPALTAAGPIEARHFTKPEHWRLFRAIVTSLDGDLPQALGNADFIAELAAEAPDIAAVPPHAAAIVDAWIRRSLVHIAFAMATNATANTGLSGAEALALAQRHLAELHPRPRSDGEPS